MTQSYMNIAWVEFTAGMENSCSSPIVGDECDPGFM
jgi:hypothetical protein